MPETAESFGLGLVGALVAAAVVAVVLEGESPGELAKQAKQNIQKQGMTTGESARGTEVGTSGKRAVRSSVPVASGRQAEQDINRALRSATDDPDDVITQNEAGAAFGRIGASPQTDPNPSPTRSSDDDLQPLSSISDEPVTTGTGGEPLSDRDFARAARNA